jgi:hypothetical protein
MKITKAKQNIIKKWMKSGAYNGYFEIDGVFYASNGHLIVKSCNKDYFEGLELVTPDSRIFSFGATLDRLYKDISNNQDNTNYCSIIAYDVKTIRANNKRHKDTSDRFTTEIHGKTYAEVIDHIMFGLSYLYDITRLYDCGNIHRTIIAHCYNCKSPVIFQEQNNNDLSIVLLPCNFAKTKGERENEYKKQCLHLAKCIEEETEAENEKKEAKAAKAAGVVPTIEPLKEYNGYLFNLGTYDYFMLTDAKRKTDTIAKAFINAVCDNKKIIQETRERALNDKATLNDFKKRIEPATLTIKESQNGIKWLNISGKGFNINNPLDELEKHFYFIDCIIPTFTEEVKTPEKVEEVKPAEVATIEKDAEVKTEAPKAETTPTTAHKSNNCLFVTVAKDIKPDKVAQLQNVAILPTLASVPTYSAYLAQKINNIVNTKRNTNNGRKAHKRTNGATLAECAGVLKTVNTS